jgi:hypothetical protein
MKRATGLLLLFLLPATLARSADTGKVFLIYDERNLSDNDRAALYATLLAAIPRDQWPTIKLEKAQKVATVVDDYYDYWYDPKQSDPDKTYLKVTTKLLSEAIRQANLGKIDHEDGIRQGMELKVPPLPVRARTATTSTKPRLFDPETLSYAFVATLSGNLTALENQTSKTIHPVKEMLAFREAPASGIAVDAALLEKALSNPKFRLPAGAVLIKTASENLQLTFPAANASPTSDWPLASFHAADAAAQLNVEQITAAVKHQKPTELWVVDWWDTPTTGHGERVLSVVYDVLQDRGVYDLLKPYVRKFDLNPQNNKSLAKTLDAFQKFLTDHGGMSADKATNTFSDARKWLASNPTAALNAAGEVQQTVNELVVQATLWNCLCQHTVISNFSWLLNDPRMRLIHKAYCADSKTVGVVAAGNQHVPLIDDYYPQTTAATDSKFINVTHATANGKVQGALSSGVPVHIAAQGNSFEFSAIHRADTGSSYAAPYVAAYAWLKSIVDGYAPETLRDQLTWASSHRTDPVSSVVAGDLFEPELLFLSRTMTPHVVINGNLRSLVGAVLNVSYTDEAGAPSSWSKTGTSTLRNGKLFVYEAAAGQYWMWFRDTGGNHRVETDPVVAITITFPGEPPLHFTPEQFAQQVSDLCL